MSWYGFQGRWFTRGQLALAVVSVYLHHHSFTESEKAFEPKNNPTCTLGSYPICRDTTQRIQINQSFDMINIHSTAPSSLWEIMSTYALESPDNNNSLYKQIPVPLQRFCDYLKPPLEAYILCQKTFVSGERDVVYH